MLALGAVGNRPRDLGRVGLLLKPTPSHVSDRSRLPQHLRGSNNLVGLDAGNPFDFFWIVTAAKLGRELESGPAGNGSLQGLNVEAAE